VFDTPGDNPGSIVVGSDDSAKSDCTAYFNARTIPRIPVLLVNGKPSANPQTDAAFFLGRRSFPRSIAIRGEDSPVDQVTSANVTAAKVVILANVGHVSAQVSDALEALLERGGGILFLPGDQANPDTFKTDFGRVAPFALRKVLLAHPANGEPPSH